MKGTYYRTGPGKSGSSRSNYLFANPEARAYVLGMTVKPADSRKALIDRTIGALKVAGVWAKLDGLYFIASHQAQAARLNAKAPGTFTLTVASVPVFVADRGYTGDGVDDILTTLFTPSTASGLMAQNSAHIGAWSLTVDGGTGHLFGSQSDVAADIFIRPTSGASFVSRINDGTDLSVANTDTHGHYGVNRSGAGAREAYKNGVAVANDTTASVALSTGRLDVMRYATTFSTSQVAAAHMGSSLTSDEWAALHSALNTWLVTVGAI